MKRESISMLSGASLTAAADPVPLADPFIICVGGVYYAYGTHSENGIDVYTSTDLKSWSYAGMALKKGDVWGEKSFWAPEVYRVGDEFIMYYSAEMHICAARASSPLGPFKQAEKRSMLPDTLAIDHTLFTDDDGKARIYFVILDTGCEIWTAELENDLETIKKDTVKFCIKAEQPWELEKGNVNEGPFVLKHNGKYYLTYSGNGCISQFYGIGCAVSDSPDGPWLKDDRNPLLQNPGALRGVGHHSVFKDKNGVLKVVFHAHNSDSEMDPRCMHLTDAAFENGKLVISKNYFSAILTPKNHVGCSIRQAKSKETKK